MAFILSGLVYSCGKDGSRLVEFNFFSSYDNSIQRAVGFIPGKWKISKQPLIVVAHYWGGDRYTAEKQGYYKHCKRLGWYVVCPELHGNHTDGATSLAALPAQHDIIDAINYMKEKYRIDKTRIYLAGRSMGGMLAQVMAAKYPDVFAAVVSGMGISDLAAWINERPDLKEKVEKECGQLTENRFEYERRSSIHYAPNFKYVPLILWHGTNDRVVPPEQTRRLHDRIRESHPYQPKIQWLHGAPHKARNFPPEWILNRVKYYQNISAPEDGIATRFFPELTLTTDEEKWFFWIWIKPNRNNLFSHVEAKIRGNRLEMSTENISEIRIDMNKVRKSIEIIDYEIKSDGELSVSLVKGHLVAAKIKLDYHASGKFIRI